jgi:hypothetical protein
VSWSQAFEEPIALADGRKLKTLKQAGQYIIDLPKSEHDANEWQAAMQALLVVVEHDGPTMFARMGMTQALSRHVERSFDPSRKDVRWGRRK